jgi:aryl-alcohol dehydrogenase-like predicted oxidoreductase
MQQVFNPVVAAGIKIFDTADSYGEKFTVLFVVVG